MKELREFLESRMTPAADGTLTDADTIWPSEVLALLPADPYACQYCGKPFDPVPYRWLCPHCKGKNTCCE